MTDRPLPTDRDKEIALTVMLAALFDNPDNERAWLAAYASLSLDEKLEQIRRESGY